VNHGEGLLEATRAFVDEAVLPGVAKWDRDDVLPDAVWDRLVAFGLPGALVPEAYGGPGLTVRELWPVWRALSRGWISLTGAVNPTGLATRLLVQDGTEDQRAHWLPLLASGEGHAAFSITEPQAGSDLSRIEMAAVVEDGGLRLSGRKRWVAGGLSSAVVFMLVRVDSELSCAVLPAQTRDSSGWAVEEIDKVGYRGVESAAYVFDSHLVPGAEILGGGEAVGEGARQMLAALDVGRVNVACRALGILDRALEEALREATSREIGEGVLGDHTHVQLRIGEMRTRILACESVIERRRRRSTWRIWRRASSRPRRRSSPLRPRPGASSWRRGSRPHAPTAPATSSPACAATRPRPRSARAPTTPSS
jgi:alkylation response protein AidB-like acyl-CoA dehydrogenase